MAFDIWRRGRLNTLGIVVLLVGIGAGDLIYLLARPDDAQTDDAILFEQEQSKAYQGEVERNVGSFGALMSRGADAVAELGKPKGLAVTIMVLSCVMAGGCFWVASRQPR